MSVPDEEMQRLVLYDDTKVHAFHTVTTAQLAKDIGLMKSTITALAKAHENTVFHKFGDLPTGRQAIDIRSLPMCTVLDDIVNFTQERFMGDRITFLRALWSPGNGGYAPDREKKQMPERLSTAWKQVAEQISDALCQWAISSESMSPPLRLALKNNHATTTIGDILDQWHKELMNRI